MRDLKRRIRITLSYLLTLLLIGGYPLAVFAQTPTDTTTTSTTTESAPPKNYVYDPVTNRWNSDEWSYNPVTGKYEAVSTQGPRTPPGPTSTPTPDSSITPVEATATDPSTVVDSPTGAATQSTTSDGTDSDTTSKATGDSTTNVNTANTINNTTNSDATTGDAAVAYNSLAGNATSGDASATDTIMNTINSSVAGAGSGIANFVANITGDVHGDILLYPMILGAMLLQAALNPVSTSTINAQTNNQIVNNVNLNATTGDATVAGNTTAGNATTGDANTVANVMNIINSIVAANQSFVGTVNIYGNLDGDILIAPDFIPQLLANNSTANQSLSANINDTQQIVNNVNLNATTGSATVAGNTTAGNATTGAANTNVVILNLTGHEIVASNSLLVFVNVLGQWVGVIVDAPMGSTAAAIGSGVDQNTTTAGASTSVINAQTNTQITNNINLDSQSGDATVAHNTKAGDATSGNATASANILNMSQSTFGLTGWFGILFINVFGSWLGSFGIDTNSGNPAATAAPASVAAQPAQAIRFIPKPATAGSSSNQSNLLLASSSVISGTQSPTTTNETQSSLVKASSSVPVGGGTTVDSQYRAMMDAIVVMGALLMVGAAARAVWPALSRRIHSVV